MANKVIYTAIAAPGAGKTQELIDKLPDYIKRDQQVVLALPTKILSSSIENRMLNAGLSPLIINSGTHEGKSSKTIEAALKSKTGNPIIITHEALHLCSPDAFKNHILIIDEVPEIIELKSNKLKKNEVNKIIENVEIHNKELRIKPGLKTCIIERINNYKACQTNQQIGSTLSKLEYEIYTAILNGNRAYLDEPEDEVKGEAKRNYCIRIAIEKNTFNCINNAKETHLLAANISGGPFDAFAQHYGYTYKESPLTPKPFTYKCKIFIYPLMDKRWSKRRALECETETETETTKHKHAGQYKHQYIDRAVANALESRPLDRFLVFRNSWTNFNFQRDFPGIRITECNYDSRGLNGYSDHTATVLLFSGEPSPPDRRSLNALADIHGIPGEKLIAAWKTKNKLEMSLQAVTRTAIRNNDNEKPVHFYVQDLEVAEYLRNTYMGQAVIDTSLMLTPTKKDGRSKLNNNDEAQITDFIRGVYGKGTKRSKIVQAMMQKWDISNSTANRRVKEVESLMALATGGLATQYDTATCI